MTEANKQSVGVVGADASGDNALEKLAAALDAAYQQAVDRGPDRLRRLGPGSVVYAMRDRILRLRDVGVGWAEITSLLNEQLQSQGMSVHQKTIESVIRPLARQRAASGGAESPAGEILPPLSVITGGNSPRSGDGTKKKDEQLPPFRGKERIR